MQYLSLSSLAFGQNLLWHFPVSEPTPVGGLSLASAAARRPLYAHTSRLYPAHSPARLSPTCTVCPSSPCPSGRHSPACPTFPSSQTPTATGLLPLLRAIGPMMGTMKPMLLLKPIPTRRFHGGSRNPQFWSKRHCRQVVIIQTPVSVVVCFMRLSFAPWFELLLTAVPVSYTHLTLPTISSV